MGRIGPTSSEILRRIFEKAGFRLSRIQGDHMVLIKEGIRRPVIISIGKEVPVFIIRNDLRTAGISREEYLRLLNDTK